MKNKNSDNQSTTNEQLFRIQQKKGTPKKKQ